MKKAVVIKVVIGTVVIGSALTYFIWLAMKFSMADYSVDEFAVKFADPNYYLDESGEKRSEVMSYSFRLEGTVKRDSVVRDLQKVTLNFVLAGNKAEIPVQYAGVVPDNFAEGREVLVGGRLATSGIFEADTVITKCESKYKAKLE